MATEMWVFVLLILNFVISTWNAYVTGRIWGEVTGWMKLIARCALIMSACGFIEVSAVVCGVALSGRWIDEWALSLIIVPVIGTGLLITIYKWIGAYKRRNSGSGTVAGWNTFAQVNNTHGALDGGISSSAFSAWEFFKPSEYKNWKIALGKIALLLVLIVAMAPLTYIIFQMGRRRSCYMRTGSEWAISHRTQCLVVPTRH
jgi:hypothetical protein